MSAAQRCGPRIQSSNHRFNGTAARSSTYMNHDATTVPATYANSAGTVIIVAGAVTSEAGRAATRRGGWASFIRVIRGVWTAACIFMQMVVYADVPT